MHLENKRSEGTWRTQGDENGCIKGQLITRLNKEAMQCEWGVLFGQQQGLYGELMNQERRQQRELSSASGLIVSSICNELEIETELVRDK